MISIESPTTDISKLLSFDDNGANFPAGSIMEESMDIDRLFPVRRAWRPPPLPDTRLGMTDELPDDVDEADVPTGPTPVPIREEARAVPPLPVTGREIGRGRDRGRGPPIDGCLSNPPSDAPSAPTPDPDTTDPDPDPDPDRDRDAPREKELDGCLPPETASLRL